MANPRQFRHHDVVRAFRAAEAAGVRDPTMRVRLPNGTLVIGGAGAKPDAAASTTRKAATPAKAAQTGRR